MILLIIFARLLFPFELPVTTNIYFPKHLSNLIASILGDNYTFCGFSFSIWNVIVLIWIIGAFYNFYRYIYANRKLFQFISLFGTDVTPAEPYAVILNQICKREQCSKKIHIIRNSFSTEPAVYWFRDYYILLPDHLNLDMDELEWILSHEVHHIIHRDLLIKILVQIICMLYWWNPFCMLVLFSILFIFEPHAISPEAAEEGIQLYDDNCYVIQKEDGTYDFYLNDEYMENINSLEYYPEGMIIYYNNGDIGRYRD